MVLRDVADDIEMHESTVSRVVSNKYIHTPRGVLPMKYFFHSGIDREYGGDISSLSVKRKIQNLVSEENASLRVKTGMPVVTMVKVVPE